MPSLKEQLEERVTRLEAENELLKTAVTRLAGAIASAGYNINTDEMHRAYRAVWEFTGFDPKTMQKDPHA